MYTSYIQCHDTQVHNTVHVHGMILSGRLLPRRMPGFCHQVHCSEHRCHVGLAADHIKVFFLKRTSVEKANADALLLRVRLSPVCMCLSFRIRCRREHAWLPAREGSVLTFPGHEGGG